MSPTSRRSASTRDDAALNEACFSRREAVCSGPNTGTPASSSSGYGAARVRHAPTPSITPAFARRQDASAQTALQEAWTMASLPSLHRGRHEDIEKACSGNPSARGERSDRRRRECSSVRRRACQHPGSRVCTNTPPAPEQVGPVGRASDQALTWSRPFQSAQRRAGTRWKRRPLPPWRMPRP